MYDCYKRGIYPPRKVYEIMHEDKGEYKLLKAFSLFAMDETKEVLKVLSGTKL